MNSMNMDHLTSSLKLVCSGIFGQCEDGKECLVNEFKMCEDEEYCLEWFEYDYGLDHLKHYRPESYKDFHRILSHKEYYSHEDERENKKRLQIEKW